MKKATRRARGWKATARKLATWASGPWFSVALLYLALVVAWLTIWKQDRIIDNAITALELCLAVPPAYRPLDEPRTRIRPLPRGETFNECQQGGMLMPGETCTMMVPLPEPFVEGAR